MILRTTLFSTALLTHDLLSQTWTGGSLLFLGPQRQPRGVSESGNSWWKSIYLVWWGEGSESLSIIDSKLSLLGQANALGIVAQKYEEGEKQLLERGRVAILHKRQKLNEQIASKLQTVPSDHSEVARLMGSLNPIVHMQVGGMIQRNPHCGHIGNADVIRLVYAISKTYLENSQEFHLDDLNLADFLRGARETPASATGTDAAPAPPVVS
jgi:hypothetical protein